MNVSVETALLRRAVVVSGLVCVFAAGQETARAAPPDGVGAARVARRVLVRGVVFDARGAPLARASVQVGAVTALTDGDGGFAARVPPGRYAIVVRAPGAAPQRVRVIDARGVRSLELVISLRAGGVTVDVEGERTRAQQAEAAKVARAKAVAPGVVTGRVVSMDRKAPVQGVRVFVRGASAEARTDREGGFQLELPPGRYVLSFIHPDFSAQSEPDVAVTSGGRVSLKVSLSPASMELAEFTVTAPRIEGGTASLLQTRKKATTMNEVIGAEQFARSGDSSAASALKRVTGLTVVGGKYVYVRGLGDRYSSTLLNRSSLPSPEPDRRVVPLDLFPTGLLEQVTIQKTYSANMPGEFGGGVVRLQTRRFPGAFKASASVGLGLVSGMTFQKARVFEGGKLDWTGFDDGSRAMPEEVRAASEDAKLLPGAKYDNADLERFGEAMPSNWGYQERRLPPNMSLSFTIGDRLSLFGKKAGVLASLTYSNDRSLIEEYRAAYRIGNGALERTSDYEFRTANDTITLGAILTGGVELSKRHRLTFTSMVNRVTDNESRFYGGFERDALTDIRIERGRWLERTLLFEQLVGAHRFGDVSLDWRYVFSQARMSEPDRHETRYDYEPGLQKYLLSNLPEGNSRVFSALRDDNHDLGLDVSWPVRLAERRIVLKSGVQAMFKERVVDTRRFTYRGKSLPEEVQALRPEVIFSPTYLDAQTGLVLNEITRGTDNYEGSQQVFGLYLMGQSAWFHKDRLQVELGLRVERSSQEVRTFDLFNPSAGAKVARLANTDLMPALNTTLKLSEQMQVRGALSRTVSRPDFRELSPAQFNDVVGGRQVEGNSEDLERGLITHADARWAWYPKVGEAVSAGVFYKKFTRPIEQTIIPGAVQTVKPKNVDSAHNVGVELEGRKGLGFVSPTLRDLTVSANLALIRSRVRLRPEDLAILTSDERALQGQSPYVFNVQLTYDNADTKTSLSALYNVSGPRIMEVGTLDLPDTYEQPFHQLDLVARRAFGDLSLSLKLKNLLNPVARTTQGLDVKPDDANIVRRFRRGRALSVGLGYAF